MVYHLQQPTGMHYVHIYHTHSTYTHVDASITSTAHVPCMYAWCTSTVHTTHITMHRIYWLPPLFAGTVVK